MEVSPFHLSMSKRMSLRAVGSDPLIAPTFKRSGGMWACLPTAQQSVLLQKSCMFKAFRMRIATPLFAFGKNADIGHSLQVLGDEGALELVRAFGRFAMTEYLLCRQSERRSLPREAPSFTSGGKARERRDLQEKSCISLPYMV